MQHPKLSQILADVKQSLITLYQENLEKIILYGSQARKDATQFSDIDILVILKPNINPYQEINKTGEIIAEICLKYDIVISRHFISLDKFKSSNTPFLYNIKKEGITL
jgi:predicted nucleotidyltransferase